MPLAPRQETYLSYYCKDSQPVLARRNPSVPGASVWPAARMQPNQHHRPDAYQADPQGHAGIGRPPQSEVKPTVMKPIKVNRLMLKKWGW